jgi:hypothetical protein
MALIEVPAGQIGDAAAAIERAVNGAQGVTSLGSVASAAPAAGNASASAAVESFVSAWGGGLGVLLGDAELLGQLLQNAAGFYDMTETSIAGAAR